MAARFPFYSPFHFSGNKPIACLDIDGLEDINYMPSFIANQGEAAMNLLTSTELGKSVVALFQLQETFFNYPGNKGYDIFLTSTYMAPYGSTSRISKGPYSRKAFAGNANAIDDDSDLFSLQTVILHVKNNNDGDISKYLSTKKGLTDEILYSPELEETLSKGRGLIIIQLSPNNKKEGFNNMSESWASTLFHEIFSHAINASREIILPQEKEHLLSNGVEADRVGDLKTEGSPQDTFDKQLVQNQEKEKK